MQILTLFSALAFSTAALASTPKVGDWVSFDQVLTYTGGKTSYSWGKKIAGVNQSHTVYVVNSWDSSGQQLQSEASPLELTYVDDLKKFCDSFADYGIPHSIEELQTPLKTFHTCKTQEASETVWYSDEVPFGKVKTLQKMPGGNSREETIKDLGWGN